MGDNKPYPCDIEGENDTRIVFLLLYLVMSRLDRFLVSSDWEDLFSPLEVCVMPRPSSNHIHLLLSGVICRHRPTPFRFQLMWFLYPRFKDLVAD